MVRLLVDTDRRRSVAVGALILVAGLLPPAITYASGRAVRELTALLRRGGTTSAVIGAATIVAALFVVDQAVGPVLALAAQRFARVVDRWMTSTVMTTVMGPTRIDEIEDAAHQDVVAIALGRSDWARSAGGFVEGAADQWPRRIAGAGAVFLVATWSPWLAVLLPMVSLVGLQVWRRSFFSISVGPEADVEGVRASSYALGIAINTEFSRETRLFEMRPWLLARHEALWLRAMRPVWRHRSRSSVLVAGAIAANAAVRLLGLGLLGRAALRGEVSAASVAVVALAILQASQITWISGTAELGMQRCLASVGAVLALRDAGAAPCDGPPRSRVAAAVASKARPIAVPPPAEMIRFERVGFAYPGGRDVLVGLDLEIPIGRSLAIVGFNGAGKTTAVKLLAGLYRPSRGRITVDSTDLAAVDARGWQRHVAAIFQDFGRYPLTARENIGWGAPAHLDDEAGIRRAAELAGAMAVIDGLPAGFDTVLDRRFEGGAEAPGGEWQRIAIARALFAVHHGASVLVLDEPTAQLDARAEADIYDRFLKLTTGVTTVVVSHRFSTIRRADRIVVLEDGAIIEAGAHDDLIARAGRYAELFRVQADALVGGNGRANE
jgi:ATP-binding cassette subfamily B protein